MTARRGGLGRGLGALIPTGTDPASGPGPADVVFRAGSPAGAQVGAMYREIPLDSVVPNPRQPRQAFSEDALAELAASIREVGLLQPVVVREVLPGRYELVVGERRWRACQRAGLPAIPAIVRTTPDDALLRDALLENLHREQLNPLEEAAAYAQLLNDFGVTHEELGQRLGRSRSAVSNTVRLLNLPAPVQRRVAAGVLSAGHARALLGLDDADQQERLAGRIVAEGLSVRSAEELVAVGADTPAARPVRQAPPRDPGLDPIAAALSDRLETRVRITANRRRGTLVVEFAGREDLDRILAAMTPGLLSADARG